MARRTTNTFQLPSPAASSSRWNSSTEPVYLYMMMYGVMHVTTPLIKNIMARSLLLLKWTPSTEAGKFMMR